MISCKFCGNENMDNAQQCYICGKSLASAQINSLVNVGGDQQSQYHGVNDNLPYGSNVQVATRFQSDTGGGAHSGPTQQSFGAQMMAGAGEEKKKGSAKTVIAVILLLAALGLLVWYFCFSEHAIVHF